MVEINNASRKQKLPELKQTLVSWRERLPNKWDSPIVWADLLKWRYQMFGMILNTFANWEPLKVRRRERKGLFV